jgi:hypothetical protein
MTRSRLRLADLLRRSLGPDRWFTMALLAAMLLRWAIGLALLLDVPHLEFHARTWYFHTGGDQHDYFELALNLLRGERASNPVGLGAALPMVPLVALTGATDYRQILWPLVLLNGFVFGGLSVVLIGLIGRDYTADRRAGALAAALWAALPVPLYLVLGLHWDAEAVRASAIPKIMWLNGISDGHAAIGMLLGVWLLGRGLDGGKARDWILAGIGFGYAVMGRVQVAPLVLGVVTLVALRGGVGRGRGLIELIWLGLGGMIGYLPQAVYNTRFFGFPLGTGYLGEIDDIGEYGGLIGWCKQFFPYSPTHLLEAAGYYVIRHPALGIVSIIGAGLGLVGLVMVWRRRGWMYTAILFCVPIGNVLLNASAWMFPSDPVRFTMLSYPYLLAIGSALALWLWDALRTTRRREVRSPTTEVGLAGNEPGS